MPKTSGNTPTIADWSSFKSVHNKYHNLILTAKNITTLTLSLHLLTTPNGSGKLSANYCTANLLHSYLPLPQVSPLLAHLLLSSPMKYLNFLCSLLATPPQLLHTYLSFCNTFCFLHFTLPLNPKSIRLYQTAPTSNLIPIDSHLASQKECASVLVPNITNIANLSLTSGQFHPILKESVISPLCMKSTLDRNQLSNYHLISLTFLSYPK